VRNTSLIGAVGRSPRSWIALNTGVSSSFSRIHRPNTTSTADSRNATRQPQDMNCSSLSRTPSSASTPFAIRFPAGGPICAAEAQNPRCLGSPYSLDSRTAPPHSPPRPTPCANRRTTSSTPASPPMAACVGSRPISIVAMPVMSSVVTSTRLRPSWSPSLPNRNPPSGRDRYPTA
jgi:hypothetical protein